MTTNDRNALWAVLILTMLNTAILIAFAVARILEQ